MAGKETRLDKYVAEGAGITRKEAKSALSKGRVSVNGEVCKNGDSKVSAEDEVTLDGRSLKTEEFLYLMLYKPAGVVSATEDSRDRTVLDLVREQQTENADSVGDTGFFLGKREIFPVGRLDKDTEGLLLLTDDGELAHRLLSPKKHVDKVYFARLSGEVPEDAVSRFAAGIQVGQEYQALPAKLEVLSSADGVSEVKITLREGKFHQVKRMCHEIGCEVTYLKRISMGKLLLDETMQPGECRRLTAEELEEIKRS
ncbi:MAG: rRNA pseudouridine synthase [Lachnospiraceae bacterium]|nr:rRNA pseudouridine synthase [Lachnospiraceae bacterium]